MAGTPEGGQAAAAKNKKLYGDDYYHNIGAKGGAKSRGGGFAADRDKASQAGQIGGAKSGEVRRARRDARLAANPKPKKRNRRKSAGGQQP